MTKKVVVASGYFDPVHYGHLDYLQKSKALGDTLIVIVNNDKQALQAKGRSFMPARERVKLLRSFWCVDAAVESIDFDRSVCKTLAMLHPDIFCNGGDQFNDMIPEAEVCEELGISMVDCLGAKVHTSSWMVTRPKIAPPQPLQLKAVVEADVPAIVRRAVEDSGGVLLASRSMVFREMYNGRNVLAPNASSANADSRGYVPVERWIISKTEAENPVCKEGEGVSLLLTQDGEVRFDIACQDKRTEFLLLGPYGKHWPLTKVLDIGGVAYRPSFAKPGEEEVPPIPAHVHPGYNKDGVCCMQEGKLEAYFFPPVDDTTVYAGKVAEPEKVITRLGLRPEVTKEEVRTALDKFGEDDSLYDLMQVYPIQPNTSWTIQPGTIHAPGPWPTFEIQRAQDDAHILAWKLGQPIKGGSKPLSKIWQSNFAKGLADADKVMEQCVHYKASVDPKFKEKWFRPCDALEEGAWGRRRRIFHHEFNGEGFEILPGQSYERPGGEEPYAALVWSGSGTVNAVSDERRKFEPLQLQALTSNNSEFLVTPGTTVRLTNTSTSHVLLIYTVLPISATESWFVSPKDWVD
jgi:D-beta-D-heptose 7-phosphate kinase/D-beta-D-heptose 1-phosphate adenosyltransferase